MGVPLQEVSRGGDRDERAVYHDDIGDYSTNEQTMDGTASAVLLWPLETAAEEPRGPRVPTP